MPSDTFCSWHVFQVLGKVDEDGTTPRCDHVKTIGHADIGIGGVGCRIDIEADTHDVLVCVG
jgi:hypothetical protein